MPVQNRKVLKDYLKKKKTLDNFVFACDQIKKLKYITINNFK